jgi:molecular chaperone DnaJ
VIKEKDYYRVLGVPRNADARAIKDAFRDLALKFHPDRNREAGAEDRFKEIAEAYAVLSDPEKRRQYDLRGFPGVAGFSPEDLFAGIDLEDVFGGFARDFGFGESIFDRFFHTARPRRGRDVEIVAEVPLELIATGGMQRIQVPHEVTCPRCQGSGAEPPVQPRQCNVCGGSGSLVSERVEGKVKMQQITICTACRGSGKLIDSPCQTCDGAGKIEEREEIAIQIPIGVEEGTALRLRGKGMPGPSDTPPGDLLVVIRSAADPRFRRRGMDLWHSEVIPIEDAVLGSSIEVPTLEEPVLVTIPPGMQPGGILRLAGKGLPSCGEARRGDLMLVIEVAVPTEVDDEERRLFERLRSLHQPHRMRETVTRP